MTKSVYIPHHSLGEAVGIAQFLFGAERINEQMHTLVGWAIILGYGRNYCRPNFPNPGIHLAEYPKFWETFLELRSFTTFWQDIIDPGLPPDKDKTEFEVRAAETYDILHLALNKCQSAAGITQTQSPIVTPEQEQLLLHKAARGPGPHLKALELYRAGNALVFLCNHWHIVRRAV